MRNDLITLVTRYKDGKEVKENTAEIFATKKSLNRNEFYSGYGVGLKPKYIFDILPDEYHLADVDLDQKHFEATHVRYNNIDYPIIRTYEKNFSSMELTVG